MRMLRVLSVFGLTSLSFAGTANQTDWSGGDGIVGPVIDWVDRFFSYSEIQFSNYPGSLQLEYDPIKHVVCDNSNGPCSVYAADIDGDDDMDLLSAAHYDDDIIWWENLDGSGTLWTQHTIYTFFYCANSVYAEDIDGDGDIDVLGSCSGTIDAEEEITWWENTDGSGTLWIPHVVDNYYPSVSSVYAADVDGDGDIDVLGSAFLSDDITWWENLNAIGTSWIERTIDGNFNCAFSVYASDIDGDGDIDVLGAAAVADDITWWENYNGSGTQWMEHTIDGDFNGAYSVRAADIDSDGDMDVLGAALADDEITWWENEDGSGATWTEHTIDNDLDWACTVHATDIDGDGDIDVVGAGKNAYKIDWWENIDGVGTTWAEHLVDDYVSAPMSVYAEDMNGDGYVDVLGAALNSDQIAWWDVNRYQATGNLESSILDLQEHPEWLDINWNCNEPSGAYLLFQVRTSSDSSNMGEWSDILTDPCCISDIVSDGDHFLQYSTYLTTSSLYTTPILEDVTLSWDPTEIEVEGGINAYLLYGAVPNPTNTSPALQFALPEPSFVSLTVYDLSGRIMYSTGSEYLEGRHNIALDSYGSGIYFVRMQAGNFESVQRFVVIE